MRKDAEFSGYSIDTEHTFSEIRQVVLKKSDEHDLIIIVYYKDGRVRMFYL